MKLRDHPPLHLTYCMNVHPGETWAENFAAIREHALVVKGRVAPDVAFGLGLRLSARAAGELAEGFRLAELKGFLEAQGLYAFTINGFPYGVFHGAAVKADVYRPDWRTAERLDYTMRLADILAALLPEGVSGSISTVPGSYKEWLAGEGDVALMTDNLMRCVAHLVEIRSRTGREVHLGLEPEPDCFLERTDEVVAFFAGPLRERGIGVLSRLTGLSSAASGAAIAKHLGICFDTCHLALQHEGLSESLRTLAEQGIRISKVQLSAALRVEGDARTPGRLAPFADPVYLHQVRIAGRDGRSAGAFRDLPEALQAAGYDCEAAPGGEWRVHFHVPLYFAGNGGLASTRDDMDGEFFNALKSGVTEHMEVETYTFGVLPPELRTPGVDESIARELEWVKARLGSESRAVE